MKKVTIITTYFGNFNNYFNLWKQAISYNETINFKLITDNIVEGLPSNMEVIRMSFSDIQNKIRAFFDFPIVIDTSYKMSEYQPLFAIIFPELVKEADFWGYCEMDLILGNLRNFFTEDILNKYEKIYWLGHLTLYKNNEKMNHLALLNHKYPTATYKQAFTTPYNYHFIEGGAMKWIAKYFGCKCYEEIEFADISFKYFNFTLAHGSDVSCPQIFRWKDGSIYRIFVRDNLIQEQEMSYVHLQKRKMSNIVKDPFKSYLIIPNKFVDDREMTIEFILSNSYDTKEWRDWHKRFWRDYYIRTIRQGGIKIKLDKIIRKILYTKNIKRGIQCLNL